MCQQVVFFALKIFPLSFHATRCSKRFNQAPKIVIITRCN